MKQAPNQADNNATHVVFHYPPELFQLLKDTIPVLVRSKNDVLLFFQTAGVPRELMADLAKRVATDAVNISKFEIARLVLQRLNESKHLYLQQMRELLRRVTEFEDFSTCWPSDQLKAKGLVAEIRRITETKDAFTRMRIEREQEANLRKQESQKKIDDRLKVKAALESVRRDLCDLIKEPDAHKRGKALEGVLNRLFAAYGILVREAFTVKGACGEGVIEQIDGVIELDGDLFLVEMKWWNKSLGTNEVAPHLVRVYGRGTQAKGIFISYTDYSDPAISTCRDALAGGALVVLCKLSEIVLVLEKFDDGADLKSVLRAKLHTALLEKRPWHEYKG